MKFPEFLEAGWTDHATDAAAVAQRLPDGLHLVTSPDELGALAHLTVHVMGEHLGRWQDGAGLLLRMTESPRFAKDAWTGQNLYRGLAILRHCAGDHPGAERYLALGRSSGGAAPPASDQVRFLAGVAQALTGQRRLAEAAQAFHGALAAATYGPGKGDPAARALAVAGNNLAADLEEYAARDAAGTALMKLAAHTARKYWEIAGGPREVELAEQRLQATYRAAGEQPPQ